MSIIHSNNLNNKLNYSLIEEELSKLYFYYFLVVDISKPYISNEKKEEIDSISYKFKTISNNLYSTINSLNNNIKDNKYNNMHNIDKNNNSINVVKSKLSKENNMNIAKSNITRNINYRSFNNNVSRNTINTYKKVNANKNEINNNNNSNNNENSFTYRSSVYYNSNTKLKNLKLLPDNINSSKIIISDDNKITIKNYNKIKSYIAKKPGISFVNDFNDVKSSLSECNFYKNSFMSNFNRPEYNSFISPKKSNYTNLSYIEQYNSIKKDKTSLAINLYNKSALVFINIKYYLIIGISTGEVVFYNVLTNKDCITSFKLNDIIKLSDNMIYTLDSINENSLKTVNIACSDWCEKSKLIFVSKNNIDNKAIVEYSDQLNECISSIKCYNNSLLIIGYISGSLSIYNTEIKKVLIDVNNYHYKEIMSIASISNKQNNLIVTASKDKTLLLYNMQYNNINKFQFKKEHLSWINVVTLINKDYNLIASGSGNSNESSIKLWVIDVEHSIKTLNIHSDYIVNILYNKINNDLISISNEGNIKITTLIYKFNNNKLLIDYNDKKEYSEDSAIDRCIILDADNYVIDDNNEYKSNDINIANVNSSQCLKNTHKKHKSIVSFYNIIASSWNDKENYIKLFKI